MKKTTFHGGIFLLIFLTYGLPLYSQDIEWEKSIGGKHADYLFDAIPTADYGFILAGSSLSGKTGKKLQANQGDLDYWIWKMDEKGEMEWQKSFGGSGLDLLKCIRLTRDGGFILVGSSYSNKGFDKKEDSRGDSDLWILKLNAKGVEEWQKTIGGKSQDMAQTVLQTLDGGYIIGATSDSGKNGDKEAQLHGALDYWVLKLDSKGTLEWQQTYGGVYNDVLKSIVQTEDSGYILAGYSNSPESGNKYDADFGENDFWILKISSQGVLEWQKVWGGTQDDQLEVMLKTKDGALILGGNSNSPLSKSKTVSNTSGTDFWVIKMTLEGEEVWQKNYNFGKGDVLTSIVEDSEGNLLLGGFAKPEEKDKRKSDKEDINDYALIKIKPDGETIWKRTLGSAGEEIMNKVILTRDGGMLVTGTSNGKASRDKKSTIGSNDFWIVKLKNEKKEKVRLKIEAFPNPTTEFTNIIVGYEYDNGTCSVFDISGRLIESFAIAKERTIPVNLGQLPEGIYIVEIKTRHSKDAVKIIKGITRH